MSDENETLSAAAAVSATEETRPATEAITSAPDEDAAADGKDAGTDEMSNDAGLKPSDQQSIDDPSAKADEAVKAVDTQDNASTAVVTNGGADAGKKDKKRRSSGIPEHKTKKLNKKKSMLDLHLNVQPGEYWYARMKGHPPWPSIICDEELLPDTLLGKRPVSAARIDGSYREDFMEGGKNARDRRYPVMFLGTNEFAWQVNTDLLPLDMEDLKGMVERNEQGKKSKSLWSAFQVASEEHELDHFKTLLRDAEKSRQEEIRKMEEAEAKKLEKKEKGKRKSAAGDDDAEMEDADGDVDAKKAKSSKKRKKDAESDAEGKPPKTQKTTKLKVNGPKPPKDEPLKSKKSNKSKKVAKASEDSESPKPQEKPMTEAERKDKNHKSVLYLRHRLQKGFLNRQDPPKEEEMSDMAEHFNNLEGYENLEASIIKATKIHKVLKAIIKLDTIPRNDEFKFKERSQKLLSIWGTILASDLETPTTATAKGGQEATANGVKDEGEAGEAGSEAPKTNGNIKDDVEMKDAPTEAAKPEDAAAKEEESNNIVKSTETNETAKLAEVNTA